MIKLCLHIYVKFMDCFFSYEKKTLKRHIETLHHNEKNVECYICHKNVPWFDQLTHLQNCNGSRCKYCDVTFSHAYQLSQHISSEHKDRKFSCKICKKTFSKKNLCLQHVKNCVPDNVSVVFSNLLSITAKFVGLF